MHWEILCIQFKTESSILDKYHYCNVLFQIQDQSGDLQAYKLMTSVSMPVYDRRDYAVSTTAINLLCFGFTRIIFIKQLFHQSTKCKKLFQKVEGKS